jgi:insulysin
MGLVNLLIKNACFEQLRTKEQLGYIVFCRTHITENILSFQVIIQSALYNASYLTERAEAFLMTFGDTIRSLADNWEGFEDLKRSLVDFLQSRDLSLLDATERFWTEITNNEYQFDRVKQLVSMIDSLTADSVIQFYNRYLDGQSGERRRFVVELYGHGRALPKSNTNGNMKILNEADLSSFKMNASFYGQPDSSDVIKPDIDNRAYKVIHLSNGLRVLLISDPETDYSAASMSVNVGSMSDPPDVLGLAHFCEHMLFLGTKKYPNESSYSAFLSEHGGYDNAFTAEEQTNYYFKVEQQSLFEVLDRFAQFFIFPLFTKSSTQREMHAVDSEHQKNLNNEHRWLWQVTKDLTNPMSEFHRFATGTINTLNVHDIHSKLLEFYEKHYSSNQMQLVVLGQESIENLTNYVTNVFSPIPNKHVHAPCFPVYPYPLGYTGKQVWIPIVADTHSLTIKWPIQSVQENYRSGPLQYLGYLLGNEGPGSVVSVLRKRGWATSLSAGTDVDMESFSMFQIQLSVTDEGLPHINHVVDLVFDYIELIKKNGIRKEIAQDIIDVYTVNFHYRPKSDPASYVNGIASKMRYMDSPADFLSPPSRIIWNPKLIASVLCQLTPDNLLLFLLSRQSGVLHWSNINVTEPWYKINYHVANFSKENLAMWHDVSTINGDLRLPSANNYIPRNLSLLPLPEEKVPYPIAVLESPGLEVWWKQDTMFRTPEIHLNFGFYTPLASNSPSHAILLQLFGNLVRDSLMKPLYAASLAGYSYSMVPTLSGFTVSFYGYSDHTKLDQYINVVVQQLKQIATASADYLKEDNRYHIAFEELHQFFENYPISVQPYQIASLYLNIALEKPVWTISEQLEALMNITEHDFIGYAAQLFDKVYLKCLAHGNIDHQQAVSYTWKVVNGLGLKLAEIGPLAQRVHLQPGDNYVYRMKGLSDTDTNSAIKIVYQIGPVCFEGNHTQVCNRSFLQRSLRMGLISLIIENACFDQLRTKEQLGYIVFCGIEFSENIESFHVIIQSALYNASYLTERAETFLTTFGQTLESMANNHVGFKDLRQSLKDLLRSKDLSLFSATQRLWGEISSNQYQFNRTNQLLSVIDSITIESVLQFYSKYLDGRSPERRRFVVEVYGHGQPVPQGSHDKHVTVLHEGDLKSFKQKAKYYQHP